MTRKMSPAETCTCCGRVGPAFVDVIQCADRSFVTADSPDLPPLCDSCNYAQRRWDAAEACRRNPALSYPFTEGPPKTPPVRR